VTTSVGRASGRLDLLGGVADYAGALVLEVPTDVATTVTAEEVGAFEVGDRRLTTDELQELATLSDAEARAALADWPAWTLYVVGVAIVLVRHGVIGPPTVRLTVASDVPIAMGVSSSAALEVATGRALGADRVIDPLRLATLCQSAENGIVGAPCGIMDQVAVAVGRPGAVLPILCRPAAVDPPVSLPPGVEVVGWPSGAAHDVSGDPYGQARAASFMGKRIAEEKLGHPVTWTSELPDECVAALPDEVDGASFIDRWGATDDALSLIDPGATYPVRAATTFGVEEHQRTELAAGLIRAGLVHGLRPVMAASHAGYAAMGLDHPATDAIVADALGRPGVHGARASGGGSGGSVVVVCDTGTLDDIEGIIR
jgi:galactokinase